MRNIAYLACFMTSAVCVTSPVFAKEPTYEEALAIYAFGSPAYRACEAAAKQVKTGEVLKAEFKNERGIFVYELDLRSDDGHDWDIECRADSAEIVEIEEEVSSVQHPLFKAKKNVTEAQARAVALDAWPGDILEIEYEIESDGAASYEFDIHTYKGIEMKVEVDATSGEIVEENQELWQEGYE